MSKKAKNASKSVLKTLSTLPDPLPPFGFYTLSLLTLYYLTRRKKEDTQFDYPSAGTLRSCLTLVEDPPYPLFVDAIFLGTLPLQSNLTVQCSYLFFLFTEHTDMCTISVCVQFYTKHDCIPIICVCVTFMKYFTYMCNII